MIAVFFLWSEREMEFDTSKGFCSGIYIHDGSCEFTWHSVKHTHPEITAKNCKDCSCPPAKSHRRQYQAKRREMLSQN